MYIIRGVLQDIAVMGLMLLTTSVYCTVSRRKSSEQDRYHVISHYFLHQLNGCVWLEGLWSRDRTDEHYWLAWRLVRSSSKHWARKLVVITVFWGILKLGHVVYWSSEQGRLLVNALYALIQSQLRMCWCDTMSWDETCFLQSLVKV